MKSWNPVAVVLLALLAGGGAFWLAPGPADEAEAARDGEENWGLPVLPPRAAPEQAYQRLLRLQPWGQTGATAKTPGPVAGKTTVWRLRGVVGVMEGRRYALIDSGDGQVRRYRVGETLPLGEKLLEVRADRIEIETPEAERRTVALYER